jgi:hypothetical protein
MGVILAFTIQLIKYILLCTVLMNQIEKVLLLVHVPVVATPRLGSVTIMPI